VPVSPSSDRGPLVERIRSVVAPPAVLSRDRERELTPRQREILGELGRIFDKGFADLTMAELASQLNCSLRTLYGLAPSRNELVLMVVDRNLRNVGRAAHAAIEPEMTALEAVRAYLGAATVAVSDLTEEFAHDMSEVGAGLDLNEAHSNYLVDVTRTLLDIAVDEGEIDPVDTAAVARVIAGLGRDFARPEVMTQLSSTPKVAADAMLDVVLAGLQKPR
jgi:AcrR family transcriptional regulator